LKLQLSSLRPVAGVQSHHVEAEKDGPCALQSSEFTVKNVCHALNRDGTALVVGPVTASTDLLIAPTAAISIFVDNAGITLIDECLA
jgi:hypothetical protein